MNSWSRLDGFLQTDPLDAGCAETFECIEIFVELALLRSNPELLYLGIVAHLRNCRPCAEDYEGLLALVGGSTS